MRKQRNWTRDLANIIFLAFIFWALYFLMTAVTGCSTTGIAPPTAPPPKIQLTMIGSLDGVPFEGVALGSANKSHTITVQSVNNVSYFTAKSCHRSEKHQDVITQGWIVSTKSWSWVYTQAPTIEDTGDCILRLCMFSTTVGAPAAACGDVDFKSTRYTLPSTNICNGASGSATGTSICHTQSGLIERMKFAASVVVAPPTVDQKTQASTQIPNQCTGNFLDDANTLWEYIMPENECTIIFMEKTPPHRRAKLTVIPYDLTQYTQSQ